jgi:hypothetical protein
MNFDPALISAEKPSLVKKHSRHRTHLLLVKGSGADRKYYQLDFYDHDKSEFMDILQNHHYLFTINRVGSEGYNSREEAEVYLGSNIEYTIRINDDSRSVTSNGQMAVVTNVDTVWITGDVTDQAVTKFRYIDPPAEILHGPIPMSVRATDTVFIDIATIQPKTADLIITSPTGT